MKTSNLLISFAIVGLFIIAFLSFGAQFQTENHVNSTIMNDSRLSGMSSSIHTQLYSSEKPINDSTQAFEDTGGTKDSFVGSIFFGSIKAIGNTIGGFAKGIFNAVIDPLLKVLGLPAEVRVVVGTVLSIILMTIIALLAWRLYRQGE